MRLFIDTWGWLTLRDRREAHHKEVQAFYRKVQDQNGRIFTTNYVLDEPLTEKDLERRRQRVNC